jgi:uncharacterized protein YdhG (YjbR/CyaY superfamily)
MSHKAISPQQYLKDLPEEQKKAANKLRDTIVSNLPAGFTEVMSYGMIGYVVPHSLYPAGYHCDPKQPLPFMALASQKNHLSLHHMGLYADPDLLEWFKAEYDKGSKVKLDMGKSCIRFKKPEHIPLDLIAALCTKMKVSDWVALYERSVRR